MKERPILMKGAMVRAILKGRKIQTRRIIKPQPSGSNTQNDPYGWRWKWTPTDKRIPIFEWGKDTTGWISMLKHCPYGVPGDRLWVKETWVELLHTSPATDRPELCEGDKLIEPATSYTDDSGQQRWHYNGRVIAYRATSAVEFCDGDGFIGESANKDDMAKWKPSIFMPRWASRITLEIEAVRVERVNEITREDCIAEGIYQKGGQWIIDGAVTGLGWMQPEGAYRELWESINGAKSWDANPWVWVIQFRRITP